MPEVPGVMTAGAGVADKTEHDGKSLRERRLNHGRKLSLSLGAEELRLPADVIQQQQHLLQVQQQQRLRRQQRRQRGPGPHATHAAWPQSAPPPTAHAPPPHAPHSAPVSAIPAPVPVSAGSESPNAEAYTVKRFLVIKYEDDGNGVLPPPLASATVKAAVEAAQCLGQGAGQGAGQGKGKPTMKQDDQGVKQHHGDRLGTEHPVDAVTVTNGGHRRGDSFARTRRGSVYPRYQRSASTTTFPEDEDANKCCFTILLTKWGRRVSASVRRMLEHPLCPSSTRITRFICMVIIGLLFLAAAILLVGGNGWSQIVAAVVLAQVVGVLIHKATSLPPLLGMLLVGLLMRQLGYVEYFSVQHEAIIYIARSWALVVLMVRTGFQLDSTAGVRGLSPVMVVMAILPGLVEFSCVTIMAVFVLGMPASFGLMAGIIMAAACPSILRPCFSMMGAGRAVKAVLMSVACLNDLIVIVAFGVAVAITFADGDSLPYVFLHRLMGTGCGVLLGVVFGLVLHVVPDRHDPQAVSLRSVLMGSVGLFAMLGFARIGFFGGGPAACIVVAWTASRGWRKQGWGPEYSENPVATVFDVLWRIMQPVMFCLMGADVDLSTYDQDKLLFTVVVLLCTWLIRIVVSMAVTSYTDLSIKERLYVTLAWVPKAGVQAALCPLALEQARYRGDKGDILVYSRDVMHFVLLAVVLTAPLSAALTSRLGLANVLLPESGRSRRTSTVSRVDGAGQAAGPSHSQSSQPC